MRCILEPGSTLKLVPFVGVTAAGKSAGRRSENMDELTGPQREWTCPTTKLTCWGRSVSYESKKHYMRPRSGAAPASAALGLTRCLGPSFNRFVLGR